MCNTRRPKPNSKAHLRQWTQHLLLAFCACALLAPLLGHALPEDATKPVEISADRTEFDNGKQQHTLSGNVQITQGSMRISADRITLQLKNGEITEVLGHLTAVEP